MKKGIAFLVCIFLGVSLIAPVSAIKSVPVKSITLSSKSVSLAVGKTLTLQAAFSPSNTTQKQVSYKTSDKNVASVDGTGKITAVKVGTATITVTSTANSKVYAECKVTVAAPGFDDVSDSSELPSFTGKTKRLLVWNAHGTGEGKRYVSSHDVVSPEIKRIFGIEFDKEESFDNAGQDMNAKLSILAATEEWPHIMQGGASGDIETLVKNNLIYDLTSYLPKYAPHIWKYMKEQMPTTVKNGYKHTGKQYSIPICFNPDVETAIKFYPNMDIQKYAFISAPLDAQGHFSNLWVRDDILKLAYPQAKTQKQIEELYMKNGKFTRNDVYDVPLKSYNDVVNFFYKIAKVIKDKKIKEGGKPVYATYVFSGQDNYQRSAFLNGFMRGLPSWDYFIHFDGETKKLEYGFKQSWFKQDMLMFNKLVRDGVAPASCLIDNNEIFQTKMNNGEYAITYAYDTPDRSKIQAAKKPWDFRKVYIDIPQNTKKFLYPNTEPNAALNISIFKSKVKEAELIRILQCYDFMATGTGVKLMTWGPKTAGLWTIKNGKRVFTNKEVEDCAVNDVANKANEKYNIIGNGEVPLAWPQMIVPLLKFGGIYNPKYEYDKTKDKTRDPKDADRFFTSGLFGQIAKTKGGIGKNPKIYYLLDDVQGFKKFWDVRATGFESVMLKVMAAKDDAEFNKLYAEMEKFAERNHLTAATLAEANATYKKTYPDDWEVYTRSFK